MADEQHLLRRRAGSFDVGEGNVGDDVKEIGQHGGTIYESRMSAETETTSTTKTVTTTNEDNNNKSDRKSKSISRIKNKNLLKDGKDGNERLSLLRSSTSLGDAGSHYHNPQEVDAATSSWFSAALYSSEEQDTPLAGLGSVSYFPDQVARVSYVASVVKPDVEGDYLKDLKGGMDLLARRLAPPYFPGTIVRGITAQVDGYFPSACPSKKFTNCQDVTASIGIYLNAIPIEQERTDSAVGSYKVGVEDNKGSATTVDPSTMTQELLAFQESFEAAIANNELQEAIKQGYLQKQDGDDTPAVVIVTDTIDDVDTGVVVADSLVEAPPMPAEASVAEAAMGSDSKIGATGDTGSVPASTTGGTGSGSTLTSISVDEPFATALNPTPVAVTAAGTTDDTRSVGLATGGVIGTALVTVLLVGLLGVAQLRRKRGGNGGTTATAAKSKRRYHGSRRSKSSEQHQQPAATCVEDSDDYDQSGQNLLRHVYIADNDDGNDEEQGFAVTSVAISNFTSPGHERLVPVADNGSGSFTLGNGNGTDPDADIKMAYSSSTNSDKNSPNNSPNKTIVVENTESLNVETVDDLVKKIVASSETRVSFTDSDHNGSIQNFTEVNNYEEDEDETDYVLGEDDDSDSSVGEHLLSASKSAELLLLQQSSRNEEISEEEILPEQQAGSSTAATDVAPNNETRKETIDSHNNYTIPSVDTSNSDPQTRAIPVSPLQSPPSAGPSVQSSNPSVGTTEDIHSINELDLAIANGDWASVGATAAVLASGSPLVDQTPTSGNASRRSSSASSAALSDFSQMEDELDKLIEAGDWQAVVIAAAKFDAEGSYMGEDASRRSSTQASDANSYASVMDNSSTGRSASMGGKSVNTSASQRERLLEIRARVIQLVRDVVPEEVDNVDEMMLQFKGKEEDLLETLRTMKERSVAKKARLEAQKIARRNTRSRDKTEGFQPAVAANSNESILEDSDETDEIYFESNTSTSVTDGDEIAGSSGSYSGIEDFGSFEHATKVDPDKAAAAAAAWAIERSLNEMMEKEQQQEGFL